VSNGPPSSTCAWCSAELNGRAAPFAGVLDCLRCGALTTDPWPSDEQLDRAYGGWYRPATGRFMPPLDWALRTSRKRLAGPIDALAPPGRVLDVGAGDGTLLDALRELGRDALGLERRADRSDVRDVEVTELDEPFAAIVFWHTLEHLRDPSRAVAHAAQLLVPGGVLMIAVPNPRGLQARAFGARWFGLDLPRHLVHLPAATLVRGVQDAGLTVERVSHWRAGLVLFGMLHGLVGLLPGHPDLYDAIRRPDARRSPLTGGRRGAILAAAAALLPLAVVLSALEVLLRRSGNVYVEARR
jgi:2-polyprenyl-3-methyl-5-hydroxy-6-metoxy-1,4-benzoquinol methylase